MEVEVEELFYPKDIENNILRETMESARDRFAVLAHWLDIELPEGRYKTLVLTKLEEAAMFATKAFSHKE